jgi:hypothetical protein
VAAGEIHIELAVNFAEDPKLRSLLRYGPEVRGLRDLYVLMICYCKRNLTDGFVPAEEIGLMVYPDTWDNGQRDAKRLIEAGLLLEADGGYIVAAYVKRNRTKEEVLALLRDKAVGGSLGNHKRWHEAKGIVKADCRHCNPELDRSTDRTSDRSSDRTSDRGSESGASRYANRTDSGERPDAAPQQHFDGDRSDRSDDSNTTANAPHNGSGVQGDLSDLGEGGASHTDRTSDSHTDRGASRVRSPKTETETETDKNNPPTPQGGQRRKRRVDGEDYDSDPDFVRFWEAYPEKRGKFEGFKAWQAAIARGDDAELIIRAAEWFRDDPLRNPEKTKWAQGWLNNRRYKDQRPTRPRVPVGNFWEN